MKTSTPYNHILIFEEELCDVQYGFYIRNWPVPKLTVYLAVVDYGPVVVSPDRLDGPFVAAARFRHLVRWHENPVIWLTPT